MFFASAVFLCLGSILSADHELGRIGPSVHAPSAEHSLAKRADLDLAKIVASRELLEGLYRIGDSKDMTVSGTDIRVEKHVLVDFNDRASESTPEAIYVIESRGKRTFAEGHFALPDETTCRIRSEEPKVLLIGDRTGGNCRNCDLSIAVSLEERDFLRVLGQAGLDDKGNLYMVENVLEFEMFGWFCHATTPDAVIYLTVEDGKLTPDAAKNKKLCSEQIRRLNEEMCKIPRSADDTDDLPFLGTALAKFLNYRIMGKTQKGLTELEQDLRKHADGDGFIGTFSVGESKKDKSPVSEVLLNLREFLATCAPVTPPIQVQAVYSAP